LQSIFATVIITYVLYMPDKPERSPTNSPMLLVNPEGERNKGKKSGAASSRKGEEKRGNYEMYQKME